MSALKRIRNKNAIRNKSTGRSRKRKTKRTAPRGGNIK